jgi:hypothetical protein
LVVGSGLIIMTVALSLLPATRQADRLDDLMLEPSG